MEALRRQTSVRDLEIGALEKGATPPRLRPAQLKKTIAACAYFPLPGLAEELRSYVERGARPGNVLMALLSGDMHAAVALGDEAVHENLGKIAVWLYETLPIACQGSRTIVARWIAMYERQTDVAKVPTFDAIEPIAAAPAAAALTSASLAPARNPPCPSARAPCPEIAGRSPAY